MKTSSVMQKFIINGGKKLKGNIEVKGAKNDALVIFAASLLTSQPIMVSNVPEIEDTKRLLELLEKLGCKVKRIKYGEYKIKEKTLVPFFIEIWNLKQDFGGMKFVALPREENMEADRLVNRELDGKIGLFD